MVNEQTWPWRDRSWWHHDLNGVQLVVDRWHHTENCHCLSCQTHAAGSSDRTVPSAPGSEVLRQLSTHKEAEMTTHCAAVHLAIQCTAQLLNGIAELWSVTCHMGSQSATYHTRHRWTRLAITPAIQAGTRFTYHGGMKGWVDLGVGYIPRWFTHPGTNHLIATRPGVEPTTLRSQVQRPNHYTTKPPYQAQP